MRISDWAKELNIEVIPYPQPQAGDIVYRLVDVFTTAFGSWEVSNRLGSVPQWARDKYLKSTNHPQYNDDGGADRHVFGAVEQDDGNLYPHFPFEFWTFDDNSNRTVIHGKKHGWANMPMYGGSSFVPERGERGPWAWKPAAVKADVVVGAGLPANQHISWWAVWKPEIIESGPVIDPSEPETPSTDLKERVANLERQMVRLEMTLKDWAESLIGEL